MRLYPTESGLLDKDRWNLCYQFNQVNLANHFHLSIKTARKRPFRLPFDLKNRQAQKVLPLQGSPFLFRIGRRTSAILA
jgi:hypothetical protein